MILSTQKGEGKVGCISSLFVLVVLLAVGFKVVPILFSNNNLQDGCESVAARAVQLTQETILAQIREKAKELEIPEALVPGAIVVSKEGKDTGVCVVNLNYTRKVDLYGLYKFDIKTEKKLNIPFMDSTR